MSKKKVLLLFGGKEEYQISVITADFLQSVLKDVPDLEVIKKEYGSFELKEGDYDFCIPWMHGYPSETGEIQLELEAVNLPYLGCDQKSSELSFDKVASKKLFTKLGIPNTPYIELANRSQIQNAVMKLQNKKWKHVFIKAAKQGSSVGCYKAIASDTIDVEEKLKKAFDYSDNVLLETAIAGRELEVATYEYNGQVHASDPGEIVLPSDKFYNYDEKYAESSLTNTVTQAELPDEIKTKMKEFALKAWEGVGLRHLSRIDFFLTSDNQIYLNEINTFPGMTPISMFPKMLEANGHSLKDFLSQHITNK